jgi:hypothetical protein
MPEINQMNVNRTESEQWLRENNVKFRGELQAAVGAKIAQHAAEKGDSKQIQPEIMEAFVGKT